MGLLGWNNEPLKLFISKDDVGETQSAFPLLIHLSASSGKTGKDVTLVFDELESDDNRKKIALTLSDQATQCYIDIERWDTANVQAWLWAKVPLSAENDNVFYLYFDKLHDDNTDYVNDTNVGNAVNVWTGFGGVWHMTEIDSVDATGNGNTGSDTGAPEVADVKVGKGVDFIPTDRIDVGTDASISLINMEKFTVECIVIFDDTGVDEMLFTQCQGTNSWNTAIGTYDTDVATNQLKFIHRDIDGTTRDTIVTDHPIIDVPHHIVATYDTETPLKALYVDGLLVASTADGLNTTRSGPVTTTVFGHGGDIGPLNGKLDEIRVILNTAKSPEWAAMSYSSQWDNLISYDPIVKGLTLVRIITVGH